MANGEDESNQQQHNSIRGDQKMYSRTQKEDMMILVEKSNAGRVSTYILRNMIGIIVIEKIGEYWLIKLSDVSGQARQDISDLIGCLDYPSNTIDDQSDIVDPKNWGCF